MNVISHTKLNQRQMDFAKAANCKFTAGQVLEMMVLFPFFAVKNGYNFSKSILGQLFACQKDMFYRFLANGDINWRQIVYSFNRKLLGRIARRSDSEHPLNSFSIATAKKANGMRCFPQIPPLVPMRRTKNTLCAGPSRYRSLKPRGF